MQWKGKDISVYVKERAYIDTALIPLIPISFDHNVKLAVSHGEFISILTMEIERQYKGRVIQLPAYTYLLHEQSQEVNRLKNWIYHLQQNHMKHIILLTSDISWKQFEPSLDSILIWIPTLPLEHVSNLQAPVIIQDQLQQIVPIITEKWNMDKVNNSAT